MFRLTNKSLLFLFWLHNIILSHLGLLRLPRVLSDVVLVADADRSQATVRHVRDHLRIELL